MKSTAVMAGLVLGSSLLCAQDEEKKSGSYQAGLTGAKELLKGRPYAPYANRGFPMDVYFGDTHVHTAISPDAGGAGTTLGPREALRTAHGLRELRVLL